jgi:hypothetical protein
MKLQPAGTYRGVGLFIWALLFWNGFWPLPSTYIKLHGNKQLRDAAILLQLVFRTNFLQWTTPTMSCFYDNPFAIAMGHNPGISDSMAVRNFVP